MYNELDVQDLQRRLRKAEEDIAKLSRMFFCHSHNPVTGSVVRSRVEEDRLREVVKN